MVPAFSSDICKSPDKAEIGILGVNVDVEVITSVGLTVVRNETQTRDVVHQVDDPHIKFHFFFYGF